MPLAQEDILKYKKLYLQTARNYIENMQLCISHILKGIQVHNSIKQAHLDAHSLRSQSQLMGYVNIAGVAEILEQIFNQDDNENAHVDRNFLIRIQSDLTRMLESMDQIETQDKEMDLTGRIKELENAKN